MTPGATVPCEPAELSALDRAADHPDLAAYLLVQRDGWGDALRIAGVARNIYRGESAA